MMSFFLRPLVLMLLFFSVRTEAGAGPRCKYCVRTDDGRIARSSQAKQEFRKLEPCPATGETTGACPGYVIDHVVALACGGEDDAANMQWQSVVDAKAKDRWELNCSRRR